LQTPSGRGCKPRPAGEKPRPAGEQNVTDGVANPVRQEKNPVRQEARPATLYFFWLIRSAFYAIIGKLKICLILKEH